MNDVTIPKTVTDALREAMASASFKAATLKQFQELVEKVEELEKNLKYSKREVEKYRTTCSTYEHRIRTFEKDEENYNRRLVELEGREAVIHETLLQREVANAESRIYGKVFETIFQNRVTRENITKQVGHMDNGYATTTNDHEDKEVKES